MFGFRISNFGREPKSLDTPECCSFTWFADDETSGVIICTVLGQTLKSCEKFGGYLSQEIQNTETAILWESV